MRFSHDGRLLSRYIWSIITILWTRMEFLNRKKSGSVQRSFFINLIMRDYDSQCNAEKFFPENINGRSADFLLASISLLSFGFLVTIAKRDSHISREVYLFELAVLFASHGYHLVCQQFRYVKENFVSSVTDNDLSSDIIHVNINQRRY